MDKAAQGFSVRRTRSTSQPETRGERDPSEKRPFMEEHYLAAFNISMSNA
jgi:hypothetical protein